MGKLPQRGLGVLILSFALAAPAAATGFMADAASRLGDDDRHPMADIVLRDHRAGDRDRWKRWVDWREISWQGPSRRDLSSQHGDRRRIGKWSFDRADLLERFLGYRDRLNDAPVGNGAVIPEPATALLLAAGLAALAGVRRRRA